MMYLDAASQPQGPVSRERLLELLAAGDQGITAATLVWEEGSPEWAPLSRALGLSGGSARAAQAPGVRSAEAAAQRPEPLAEEAPGTPEETSFVDDDGTRYTWDRARRAFLPDSLAAAPGGDGGAFEEQQVFPGLDDDVPRAPSPPRRAAEEAEGEEEEEEEDEIEEEIRALLDEAAGGLPRPPASAPRPSAAAKRAREEAVSREAERLAAKKVKKASAPARPKAAGPNTSVYVSGLPADATEAELAAAFSKCGLLREGDDGAPRVKLYRDEAGAPKGDALIVFLKEPSVALAVALLDGAPLRPGGPGALSVAPASFAPRAPGAARAPGGRGGARKKAGRGERAPEKALGWEGWDDAADPRRCVLVLRGLFSPGEPAAPLRAELQEECARFGAVAAVRVFDQHPEGVATVKFREPRAAEDCRDVMHGRWFGGRQLAASLYDGKTDFSAPAKAAARAARESAEAEAERLERFARELEEGGD